MDDPLLRWNRIQLQSGSRPESYPYQTYRRLQRVCMVKYILIMKRYLYVLAGLALAATLASCEKDQYRTDAGNDSTPNVVLKAFSAELPNDPDCDVVVRFAANNATTDVYYLAELKSQKDGRKLSDEAYADYVVSNGTKLTVEKNPFDGS